jgi:hypothetical protein
MGEHIVRSRALQKFASTDFGTAPDDLSDGTPCAKSSHTQPSEFVGVSTHSPSNGFGSGASFGASGGDVRGCAGETGKE